MAQLGTAPRALVLRADRGVRRSVGYGPRRPRPHSGRAPRCTRMPSALSIRLKRAIARRLLHHHLGRASGFGSSLGGAPVGPVGGAAAIRARAPWPNCCRRSRAIRPGCRGAWWATSPSVARPSTSCPARRPAAASSEPAAARGAAPAARPARRPSSPSVAACRWADRSASAAGLPRACGGRARQPGRGRRQHTRRRVARRHRHQRRQHTGQRKPEVAVAAAPVSSMLFISSIVGSRLMSASDGLNLR